LFFIDQELRVWPKEASGIAAEVLSRPQIEVGALGAGHGDGRRQRLGRAHDVKLGQENLLAYGPGDMNAAGGHRGGRIEVQGGVVGGPGDGGEFMDRGARGIAQRHHRAVHPRGIAAGKPELHPGHIELAAQVERQPFIVLAQGAGLGRGVVVKRPAASSEREILKEPAPPMKLALDTARPYGYIFLSSTSGSKQISSFNNSLASSRRRR
jgi:hypothetical protein